MAREREKRASAQERVRKERDKVVKLRKEVPFSVTPFETQTIASLTQLANYQHLESSFGNAEMLS